METATSIPEDLELVYYKEKLLINLMKEISTNKSNLSESLKNKLKTVLADINLSLYMSLHTPKENDYRRSNIFGLAPIEIEDFTYNEQKCVLTELEVTILEKYPKLLETYDEITGGMIEKNMTTHESKASKEQTKLIELSNTYVSRLGESAALHLEMCRSMKEWVDIRLGEAVDNAEDSVQLYDIKNKCLELKARIVDAQLSLDVYGQNSNVMAYMEINKDITKKIDHLRDEIAVYRKIIDDGL